MKKIFLSDRALGVARERYFMNDEDWDLCSRRVANTIASVEKHDIKEKIFKDFYEMINEMNFIPGGRVLRNSGMRSGSLFNCYHLPIDDSIEEIGRCMKDSLTLWSEGGGVGINFSPLRPKGDAIMGKGGESSGLVSFIEAIDAVAKVVEGGGGRRAAGIAHVSVDHPEVLDFIDAKLVHGKLQHFNISVSINNAFIDAVEADRDWEFRFQQRSYGKMSARKIWDKIIDNMINSAEPGLLNWDKFTKNNSYYFSPVVGTNPCLTGESLVAVADGRGDIPIKQLAEEEKDIPVFCKDNNNNVTIRMMRHPRITGYNKKILKIILDDGSFIRCTENHKIIMRDGSYKEAKDLKQDDRLHHMIKNFGKDDKPSYVGITNNSKKNFLEHRLIAEFNINRYLQKDEVVHHIDKNIKNNNWTNLEVKTHSDHNRDHQLGDDNVMRDKWWNKLNIHQKNQYRINMSNTTSGKRNGRWKGYTFKQLNKEAIKFIKKLNRPVSMKEWKKYCEDKNIPYWSSSIYEEGYRSPDHFFGSILKEFNFKLPSIGVRNYKKYVKIIEDTDLDVFFEDNTIKVRKKCEYCNNEFITLWRVRERAYCSRTCCNKSTSHRQDHNKKNDYKRRLIIKDIFLKLQSELKRDPFKYEIKEVCKSINIPFNLYGKNKKSNEFCFKNLRDIKEYSESVDLNYSVVKVIEDGYENVYNGTVDEFHNFYIKTNEDITDIGNQRNHYIECLQCGETTLEGHGVCVLGSLVLPKFIATENTNWIKLENTIKTAVRFLDNVIDANKYILKENDQVAHNTRRIGLGIMGLADYLFAKKLRYGSEKAILETERLMKFIRDATYQASIELALEKGSFPKFEPLAFSKASFIRKLPVTTKLDIKKYGIRNCTTMAIAPTGTISLVPEVTASGEPLFFKAYKTNDRLDERIYIHPLYAKLLEEGGKCPDWFVDSNDLNPEDHFEMQVALQKYVDGSVSKTINLPKEATTGELSRLLIEYMYDLKGVTVYRDGTREGQPLVPLSEEETKDYLKRERDKVDFKMDESDVECATGKCEI